jgi:hypothetical protein
MQIRTRTVLACSLWLAAFGCCAAGLLVTLAVTRPLTIGVLADGAAYALAFPLGYATIGLVLALRRPANPIGWLYAASGLIWALVVPRDPGSPSWSTPAGRSRWLPSSPPRSGSTAGRRPSPSASPCRSCCCPTGGCGRAAGEWSWSPAWPAPRWRWSVAASAQHH